MVNGCQSKLVNVVSGVLQGNVLGQLLYLLYTSELFSILENKLIGYATDSPLMATVPSPGARARAVESHNASPVTPMNYGGTVLKESDDLDMLGVTFGSEMTFEKHFLSVSRAASQRLCILRKSWW